MTRRLNDRDENPGQSGNDAALHSNQVGRVASRRDVDHGSD